MITNKRREELVALAAKLQEGGLLEIKDRRWRLRKFIQTFISREFIDAASEQFSLSREDALSLGREMGRAGLLEHVTGEHEISEEMLYFRFKSGGEFDTVRQLEGVRAELAHLRAALEARKVDDAMKVLARVEDIIGVVSAPTDHQHEDRSGALLKLLDIKPEVARKEGVLLAMGHSEVVSMACSGELVSSPSLELTYDEIVIRQEGRDVVCRLMLTELVGELQEQGSVLVLFSERRSLHVRMALKRPKVLVQAIRSACEALEHHLIRQLCVFLLRGDRQLVHALSDPHVSPPYDEKGFLGALYNVHTAVGLHVTLVEDALRREIMATSSAAVLFREGSVASSLFRHLMRSTSGKFLNATVFTLISELPKKEGDRDEDVATQKIFDAVVAQASLISNAVRQVFAMLYSLVNERFPGHARDAFGAFFFLRLLCPALSLPVDYGYKGPPLSLSVTQFLLRVSRKLQGIATSADLSDPVVARNQDTLDKLYTVELVRFDPRVGVVALEMDQQQLRRDLELLYGLLASPDACLSDILYEQLVATPSAQTTGNELLEFVELAEDLPTLHHQLASSSSTPRVSSVRKPSKHSRASVLGDELFSDSQDLSSSSGRRKKKRSASDAIVLSTPRASPRKTLTTLTSMKSAFAFEAEVREAGGVQTWINAQVEDGEAVFIIFFRGAFCPACKAWLSQFNDALPEFRSMDARVFAVGSDNMVSSHRLKQALKLDFPVLGDPDHSFSSPYGVSISKRKGYAHGVHQSGLVLRRGNQVLYSWMCTPSLGNFFGAKGRPSPSDVLERVRK